MAPMMRLQPAIADEASSTRRGAKTAPTGVVIDYAGERGQVDLLLGSAARDDSGGQDDDDDDGSHDGAAGLSKKKPSFLQAIRAQRQQRQDHHRAAAAAAAAPTAKDETETPRSDVADLETEFETSYRDSATSGVQNAAAQPGGGGGGDPGRGKSSAAEGGLASVRGSKSERARRLMVAPGALANKRTGPSGQKNGQTNGQTNKRSYTSCGGGVDSSSDESVGRSGLGQKKRTRR